jgi:hypothetical protein
VSSTLDDVCLDQEVIRKAGIAFLQIPEVVSWWEAGRPLSGGLTSRTVTAIVDRSDWDPDVEYLVQKLSIQVGITQQEMASRLLFAVP